jgi:hypothetical protein
MFKMGYNPRARSGHRDWSALYYWVFDHPLLAKVHTISGVSSFPSDAAAQAAKSRV